MRPTRRGFLRGALASALAPRLFRGDQPEETALVLIQLTGGNDGLNTVIPWSSSIYHAKRPSLRLEENEVAKIDDQVGLHPSLERMKRLYDDGGLALIQGVGYPDPIRSHFRSLDVWHTGRRAGRVSGRGWVSRACDAALPSAASSELVVHVGPRIPYSLRSAARPPLTLASEDRYRLLANSSSKQTLGSYSELATTGSSSRASRLGRIRNVMRDAESSSARIRDALANYEPKVAYPRGEFARSLGVVAATLSANLGSRVLSVELEGFDTHGEQRRTHDKLLRQLDRALVAFYRDLERHGLLDRTVIMVFSEFGRRVKENASRGTDHGTAGPMFVLGGGVRGGLHGVAPALTNLDEFDLEHTTDFRSAYSAVIERCFEIDPAEVLGARYPDLPLFRQR